MDERQYCHSVRYTPYKSSQAGNVPGSGQEIVVRVYKWGKEDQINSGFLTDTSSLSETRSNCRHKGKHTWWALIRILHLVAVGNCKMLSCKSIYM